MSNRHAVTALAAAFVTVTVAPACGQVTEDPEVAPTTTGSTAAPAPVADAAPPPIIGFGMDTGSRVTVGTEVVFDLKLTSPTGERASDETAVDVDPFIVRLPGGRIERIRASTPGSFRHTFTHAGTASLSMCARAPAWTSCAKRVVLVEGGTPGRMLTDVTAKLGTPVELRPLKDDRAYTVGVGLPVRAYLDGHKAGGAALTAHRPDGSATTLAADRTGTAWFDLDQPGMWLVQYETAIAGHDYRAELSFTVRGGAK